MDETIILKDTEFFILLAAVGMAGVPGFQQGMKPEEENVPYLIHEMVRKQVLVQKGGELAPVELLQEIVHGVKQATKILVFEDEQGKGQAYIYVGESFVLSEDSLHENNAVRLQLLTDETCLEYLDNYFFQEDILVYPEELIPKTLEEEDGKLRKRVTLYDLATGRLGREEIQWELYEGKYNKYIEIVTKENVIRKEYKGWKPDDVLQTMKKSAGGSKG